jgi:hypothetical protein
LIAVAVSLGACYILSVKNTERKIRIFAHELTLAQQYGLVAVCSLPLFYLAGAGAAIFWILGKIVFYVAKNSQQQRACSLVEVDQCFKRAYCLPPSAC